MLTDLNYIREKAVWPPLSEDARIRAYEDNLRLYRGDMSILLREAEATQLRFRSVDIPSQQRITLNLFRTVIKL